MNGASLHTVKVAEIMLDVKRSHRSIMSAAGPKGSQPSDSV